jgi:hypothetical protein
MLGYVVPQKSELKLREFEIYNAYYCAVCHSIRDRYGHLPRLLLSYDSVFLAMILSSVSETEDEIETFRCMTHPGRKRNIATRTREIDYAADIMLLLGYFHLKDDREDEGKFIGYAGEWFLRRSYRKIRAKMPEKAEQIEARLADMQALEQARTDNPDRVAEPFARIMEAVMDYPGLADIKPAKSDSHSDESYASSLRSAYRQIGYHLGKWIYLVDAIDDLEEDRKNDSYNPLRYMQMPAGTDSAKTDVQESGADRDNDERSDAQETGADGAKAGTKAANLQEAGADRDNNERLDTQEIGAGDASLAALGERLRLNLRLHLAEIAEVMDLLPLKKNSAILENIVYVGLNMKTEEITGKLKENVNAESI